MNNEQAQQSTLFGGATSGHSDDSGTDITKTSSGQAASIATSPTGQGNSDVTTSSLSTSPQISGMNVATTDSAGTHSAVPGTGASPAFDSVANPPTQSSVAKPPTQPSFARPPSQPVANTPTQSTSTAPGSGGSTPLGGPIAPTAIAQGSINMSGRGTQAGIVNGPRASEMVGTGGSGGALTAPVTNGAETGVSGVQFPVGGVGI